MKATRRIWFFRSALLAVTSLLVTSISAQAWHFRRPIPAHVHAAVAEQVRTSPHQRLSLIVNTDSQALLADSLVAGLGGQVTARWPFIQSLAVELPARQVPALAALPGVRLVVQEGRVETANKKGSDSTVGGDTSSGSTKGKTGGDTSGGDTSGSTGKTVDDSYLLNAYNYATRTDRVWAKGYDGKGVAIAIVDSGISTNTPDDFAGRILQTVKFSSGALYSSDRYGHGTHVAGIAAGSGAASGGKYIGIAPAASLLSVKFSDDNGVATEKDLVSALEWIYNNHKTFNIKVVNISSTVSTKASYKESPTNAAVEQLWFAGVTVVVSVGNRGGESCSVCYAPANDPYVISVGAMDDAGTRDLTDDFVKSWSSYGSTMDKHTKPEVVAPGAHLVAYMPTGLLRDNKANIVDNLYFRMGGTSMAAPVVTGIVALMYQVNPNLTPDEVKWLLINTTRTYKNQPRGTAGVVSADYAAFYSGTPGKANSGLAPSPMIDGSTGTINYANAYWSNAYWSNAYWSNSLQY